MGTARAPRLTVTAPRRVLPGSTYLVTRRCAQRQFLLRPSAQTNRIFRYILALAAGRFGIQLHAFCVMSNHYHLVLTDPLARLPAFTQLLDALVARALNASLARRESFWSPQGYSAVLLTTPEDVLDKVAYTLANPVAAGLVRMPSSWPGLWSGVEAVGVEPVQVQRPDQFFDPRGGLPATVPLGLVAPPGFESSIEFRARLTEVLGTQVDAAVRHAGGAFLGVARVLRMDPRSMPATDDRRRSLRPTVAARDPVRRRELLDQLRAFLQDYREAWHARRRGRPGVLFPGGTYLLRVLHGAPCVGFG